MRQRKAEAWTKWRGLVAEQSQSGQSVAGFCSERGLRSGQFFAWKKRLRETEAAKFVAVEVAPVREAKWPASGERCVNPRCYEACAAGFRKMLMCSA
jgi:hypothetical protein